MITNQEIEAGAEALYMAFPTLHEDFTPVGCPGGGLPRMADYAMALACVDEVLGTEGLDHYRQLSDRTATDTLDHPFIAALIRCRYQARGVPAKDILSDMNSKLSALLPPPAGWPKGAQSASGQLTRHAPAMRAAGWTVDSDGGHNHEHTALWTITPPPKDDEEEGC